MTNIPGFYDRENANVGANPNVSLCIEMHRSVWTEDFRDFSCRDLVAGGRLLENPELLINSSEYVKDCVRNGRFTVYPMSWRYYYSRGSAIDGYVYVYDDMGRMEIGFTSSNVRK
jgi:hypothetical protein